MRCEIDDTFPKYIRDNQEELSFLIMQEEKQSEKNIRHAKLAVKNGIYNIEVSIKRFVKKLIGR